MGLLTVDVIALGVVMSSDSQPIEIVSGGIRVLDFTGERRRDKLIERHAGGFDGLIGYVGAEEVGGEPTRAFIERVSTDASNAPLADFVTHLAHRLTAAWMKHDVQSGLWVFVAGASRRANHPASTASTSARAASRYAEAGRVARAP